MILTRNRSLKTPIIGNLRGSHRVEEMTKGRIERKRGEMEGGRKERGKAGREGR